MGSYSDLSITIRRKDLSPVTKEDLEKFECYFYEDLMDIRWREETCNPYICSDGLYIFASCIIKWALERQDFQQFASENPHLQIEIIENSEHDGGTNTRYLYEGDLFEVCSEVRYFEEPRKINWRDSVSSYAKLMDNPKFLRAFGYQIMYALQDMISNTGSEELGEYVIQSMVSRPEGEDMFSAVVGWEIDDLIARANDDLKGQEEK